MKAIILRKRDRGEADELAVFFSRDLGWLTGVAKNAKKSRVRFGGHLEPLSTVDLILRLRRNDNLVWIDQSQVVCGFLNIRNDICKISWANYFLEVASVFLPEGHPDSDLFDYLTAILTTLDSSPLNPTGLLLQEIHLLGYLGYGPRFDICPLCGEQVGLNCESIFSPANGAVCHFGCIPQVEPHGFVISPGSLAMIRRGLALDPDAANRLRLNPKGQHEFRRSLSHFVRYLRGADINSLTFLEKICYG